jgi:DNA segregation ATPase FtsK/SpoIIIE, S-DNA-T family
MPGIQFYRPARSYPPVLATKDVEIKAPPAEEATQKGIGRVLQVLLPILGGVAGLTMMLEFGNNPIFMIGGIAMAFACVVGGLSAVFLRGSRGNKRKQQQEIYRAYLQQHETHFKALAEKQALVSKRLYPGYAELVKLVQQRTYLWERRPDDKDFLSVRIGVAPTPLLCKVSVEPKRDMMAEPRPDLLAQAQALANKWSVLHDMPTLIPLREVGVLTINGKLSDTRALARALLSQIVAFQSPEDVRCMVYFPEGSASEWSWLKWLPHTGRLRQIKADKQNVPDHVRMLAHTAEDVASLLFNQIKPELDRRRRLKEDRTANAPKNIDRPHIFVIFDSFSPFNEVGRLPEMDPLFSEAEKLGVTVICLVDDLSQEPAQVRARLTVNSIGIVDYEELKEGGRRMEGIVVDAVGPELCESMARSMAPLLLAEAGAQQDLSQDVRLLELLDIAAADAFEIAETWKPLERGQLLRIPIGVRADGEPLFIDFKEAADKGMGPHGLVIGATGSGKSELLRTLIISLVITHTPEMVSFVLIDFKGGASFADFGALPHVAGIITNLAEDLSLVDRVYYAILGEQLRRQRMLHDAGNLDNIKQYQEKWQMTPGMEPMPHLLLIADEFAELLTNRPEFLDLFITIGRVGRSLGMHLLFATQRLEEGRIRGLEGHLRYRICLRTFSPDESRTVLGKPDAYYLPSAPGVGYFKVDTDTYLMFKTALISVPYIAGQAQASARSRVRAFTSAGKLVKNVGMRTGAVGTRTGTSPVPTDATVEEPSDLHTEMDVVIERIAHPSQSQAHQPVHQVWLAPLPKQLPLSTVLEQSQHQELDGRSWPQVPPYGNLRVPMGLLDMPQEQTQVPFILDFSGTGGHLALVGASQSGKSTFLRMLVAAFVLTHSPRDVQIYAIDMGGGLLRVFEQTPHVGAVCGKSEPDKIRRTVRQARKVIEDREYLFREQRIDNMATFRARRQSGEFADFPFGDVFLIIDNMALFAQEFDSLEDDLVQLAAGGLTYGVHLVIATNRSLEIRAKIRDNIGTRLELRLNDPSDSEFGRKEAASIAPGVAGRGMNKDKLQFQVALPIVDACPPDEELPPAQQALEEFLQRVQQHWDGPTAPPVLLLPAIIPFEQIASTIATTQQAGVPIGLEEFRLEPMYIDLITRGPHFIILGDSECGKTTLLRAWMRAIEQRYTPEQAMFAIVDYRKTLIDFAESKYLLTYAYNAASLNQSIGHIKAELEKRTTTAGEETLTRLLAPKLWKGQHHFLFIDDYDSISSSGNSPISPLIEYLPTGRDIGFHVVMARRVSGISRASFEPLYQRLREMGSPIFVMSGDPSEGRVLPNLYAKALPPGRGNFVERGHPSILVQVALIEPAYAAEE